MTVAVQHGLQAYDATTHAADALRETPRAGSGATHLTGRALVEAAADVLFDLRFSTWGFGDSVAFEALVDASAVLGDDRWVRFAHGWSRAWATRSRPFARLDCTAPGAAMVRVARLFDDTQLMTELRALADFLVDRPRVRGMFETWTSSPLLAPYSQADLAPIDQRLLDAPPAGAFIDCLHFDPPFFAALGRALENEGLVRLAREQALEYVDALQGSDGLFGHFVLAGDDRVFGRGWGRGQGWALLGLLDVIDALGDAADTVGLRQAAARTAEALRALQRDDGHWYAVVDRADSGEEASTAAFMATAFRRAAAAGIGDADALRASAGLARDAVVRDLDEHARLRGVSAAVYASTEISHYAHVPRGYVVPWGQGPAVLTLLDPEEGG